MKILYPAWASAILLAFLFLAPVPGAAQSFTFVEAYLDETGPIDGLNFVYATAVSPDGESVYACGGIGSGGGDNAIVVFSRAADGRLTFVENHFDDQETEGTADGLFACRDVIVSPDGKHVYTAGFSENEIGIFIRSAATGALTWSTVVRNGVGGVDGLAGVEALAITSDGSALFAAGSIDDAVAAFSRNPATGALTFEDVVKNGGGVSGLDRPTDVAVSPDDLHVYVASGSNENLAGSDAVTLFEWDGVMGDLTFSEAYFEGATQGANTIDGLNRVSSVTVTPDGKHVYATGGVDNSPQDLEWIAVFSRSSATGKLTWKEAIDDFNFCAFDILFEFETYAVVHPDNDRVFITSPRAAVAEFSRNTTTGALTFADGECLFDNLALGINLPTKLSLDATGSHFYVPGTADDAVAAFDTAGIFTDGFESGDVAAWSASVP